ncbi:MAG: IS110 family transposase [Candidatus Cloacimonadota bacterium]|nr:IS110 family transposase [Candidatus Cloacimonadota bacterium]
MKRRIIYQKSVKGKPNFSCLTVCNPNSAGIDIGSKEHWVAVSPHLAKDNVRHFSAYTCGLRAISKWLKRCHVKTVAMESTGVYWLSLYDILEQDGFEVFLCNARNVKSLPGRQKTDVNDCAWIQKLHSFGLLSSSFIPNLDIRGLRALLRYRDILTQENSRHVLRMQKNLTQMNVLLHKVLSNIMGDSGTKIIKAIIAGNTKPEQLLKLKNKSVKASNASFLKALDGNYDSLQIELLFHELQHYEYTTGIITQIDSKIRLKLIEMLKSMSDDSDNSSSDFEKLSEVDIMTFLLGVDLTQIPGISILSLRKLISETGTDMSKWEDASHFTAWLGLAPHNKKSGGKLLKSDTIHHKPKAATIFRMCASTLRRSKSHLGHFLRRKMVQKGYPKALTATARKLAVIYYLMIKNRTPYLELGEDYYIINYRYKAIRNLQKKAKRLGFNIISNKVEVFPNKEADDNCSKTRRTLV